MSYTTQEQALKQFESDKAYANESDTGCKIGDALRAELRSLHKLPHALVYTGKRCGFDVMPTSRAAMFKTYKIVKVLS